MARELDTATPGSAPVAPARDRVLVLVSPGAGARSGEASVRDLAACMNERKLGAEIVNDLATFDALVRRYRSEGRLRAVIGAGGDGTVAEIVNRVDPDVPVTVYPLGTANLLATYFQIRRDPSAMAQLIADGATASLDAGRANGRVFLIMAGCGFDADVVGRLHNRRRGRHISYWTYAQPILESIRRYRYPPLRVYLATGDGYAAEPHVARWAFAANLPCYAGGLCMAPDAVAGDGRLDVCMFGKGSLWHGLRYVGYIWLRLHRRLPDCRIEQAARVRIESDEPVPYQLDGDPGGMLPLEIEILSNRLTMLAPRGRLAELGLKTLDRASELRRA